MKKATAEWLRKAEADLRVAKKLKSARPPLHDALCFHCQQAAEKFLKAILQEYGVPVPWTHDLEKLFLISPHDPMFRIPSRGLSFLTQFAVTYRYPGASATAHQARAAARWAQRVRTEVRKRLKLRP